MYKSKRLWIIPNVKYLDLHLQKDSQALSKTFAVFLHFFVVELVLTMYLLLFLRIIYHDIQESIKKFQSYSNCVTS